MSAIEVKVIEVPGAVREVSLEEGQQTVGDALRVASLTIQPGFNIKVDGAEATESTVLTDGARIIVAKGAKGNT